MLSRFNTSLPVLERPDDPDVRLGVCAMGPVADGDQLTWMRVWVFQHTDASVAAAVGTSGKHLGGHPMVDEERPPFAGSWMIQTKLEPGSEPFAPNKPALATAMALVTHADGSKDVEHWSQAVTVRGSSGHVHPH
jgi:hypothetical protein